MNKKLLLASAGAGKTHRIVSESIQQIDKGSKVLLVTYTENNQAEIINKYKKLGGKERENFHVKGLFTFLLEDIIRPYQNYIFKNRIENINFNTSDPHKINGRNIPGRKEILKDGSYNPLYYLTMCEKKAHTTYLAKLSTRIIKESKGNPIKRIEEIYDYIYFDEVQDLIGWDYDVIKEMAKSTKLNVTCVGDFRQTIYDTATTQKQPKTPKQKLECFNKMKFEYKPMNISWRSIQCICDIADEIHADEGYKKTESLVKNVPEEFKDHFGVYVVKASDSISYIEKYKPTLLRNSISSGKEFERFSIEKINFGKSKGLGFDRVLVLPTKSYEEYLKGNKRIFDKNKTMGPKNKLYVAMTRAKYSLGFIIADKFAEQCNLPVWENI